MGVAISRPNRPPGGKQSQESDSGMHCAPDMTPITVVIQDKTKQASISKAIDKSLEKERNDNKRRVKILLLGGVDAGKSTILNQMRIIHKNGFSDDEMRNFGKHLRYNVFQQLINPFVEGLPWFKEIEEEEANDILISFQKLKCVISFMERHPSYASLPDNAHYFVPKLAVVLAKDYVPTPEDILNMRVPSTAVNEVTFNFGTKSFWNSGQRLESQELDDGDAEIKPVLIEDVLEKEAKRRRPTRLRASVQLFDEMIRCKFLKAAAFILFLNKKDLFAKKLPVRPLNKYLRGYTGKNTEQASDFIKQHFLKRKDQKDRERKIYSHFTCATDTQNIDDVFKAVYDIVVQKGLNNSGIL